MANPDDDDDRARGYGRLKLPAYPAARDAAMVVEEYFGRCRSAAGDTSEMGPKPDASAVEAIIEAAFWASLRREEGYRPKISLAYLPPELVAHPMLFQGALPMLPQVLTKVAPAVERPGIHLGVWHDGNGLHVWGTTRIVPPFCFVLEVIEPGLLVVKYPRPGDYSKFRNVIVLQGNLLKVIDERDAGTPERSGLLTSLLGLESTLPWMDPGNVLIQLAISMRAHGRGGTLLIVQQTSPKWRDSFITPVSYPVAPPFNELTDLLAEKPDINDRTVQERFRRTIDAIAGLTAVDGAAIINSRFELLGFGAKIRPRSAEQVEEVVLTEPVRGNIPERVHINRVGGTRHLSAAQFVADERDGVALVASQDGRFTVLAWSPDENRVHAHRIDALLL